MLTKKQMELLTFINDTIKKTGLTPSYEEMRVALELHSKSGIHRLVSALEERGFIKRLPNRARAIEILRLPDTVHATQAANENGVRSIPVMGRIAAGVPIAAISSNLRTLEVPAPMLGTGEHFALDVRGDSMIEAGILDGDTVIVREQHSADDGDIVVALVDDAEATLKRLRRTGKTIVLEAANPAYENQQYPANRIKVQGRMIGLIRSC